MIKKPLASAGGDAKDAGLIPGFGRSPGVGDGAHSSILAWKIPWTQAGAWRATVHGIPKSWT